jgi:hypothetical protein
MASGPATDVSRERSTLDAADAISGSTLATVSRENPTSSSSASRSAAGQSQSEARLQVELSDREVFEKMEREAAILDTLSKDFPDYDFLVDCEFLSDALVESFADYERVVAEILQDPAPELILKLYKKLRLRLLNLLGLKSVIMDGMFEWAKRLRDGTSLDSEILLVWKRSRAVRVATAMRNTVQHGGRLAEFLWHQERTSVHLQGEGETVALNLADQGWNNVSERVDGAARTWIEGLREGDPAPLTAVLDEFRRESEVMLARAREWFDRTYRAELEARHHLERELKDVREWQHTRGILSLSETPRAFSVGEVVAWKSGSCLVRVTRSRLRFGDPHYAIRVVLPPWRRERVEREVEEAELRAANALERVVIRAWQWCCRC